MCGFVGVVQFRDEKVEHDLLRRMTAALAHRGPDDEAVFLQGPVGLGFRRLSIIDLSRSARQPMANEDRSLHLVFNGEIYNHLSLRAELEELGHRFRSRTDGEVILHGYEAWGEAVVPRLDGMFAFALYDSPRDTLFAARDRYGIKPLYHCVTADRLVIASEVKGILAGGWLQAEPDDKALVEYLTFQNVWSDRTFFRGVRLLPPGHSMTVRRKVPETSFRRWWDAEFSGELSPGEIGEEDCAGALRERLHDAVERQLMSEVPLGSYLSGGMDSCSIVALAGRSIPHLMTFTAGFDVSQATGNESTFDERDGAETMSSAFGTEQYEVVVQATDLPRILPQIVWDLETPRLGMSYPNYMVARLASRFVRVALSGTGGDEVLGGYPWRYPPAAGPRTVEAFAEAVYPLWQRIIPEDAVAEAFSPRLLEARRAAPPRERILDIVKNAPHFELWSPLNQALYFEMKTFLHGLLMVGDALSMANSLEERVPFLDHALVDFSLRIPSIYKYDAAAERAMPDAQGRIETREGKRLLRRAMTGTLPDAIVKRPKQGFSAPEKSWYRGSNQAFVRDTVLSERALGRGLLRPEFVRRTVEEHTSGAKNHRLLIWSLLNLEFWHRIFLEGETPQQFALPPRGRGRP